MRKVRLSGTVLGESDPGRGARAALLNRLFAGGWNIYNSNGDQRITLSNVEKKIIESDAFVFTPGATLEDMFKAISIFVGFQTLDRNLRGKPAVIMNGDGSWNTFFSVLSHLHKLDTIKQNYNDFLLEANTPDAVLDTLDLVRAQGTPDVGRHKIEECQGTSFETPRPAGYLGNVCVFCSASLTAPHYLEEGYALGKQLAENKLGCVSGAGCSGIMGTVVKGCVEANGWAAGSNVPHIIELEGLPDGLSSFWLRPDIYTRMEVMIERSDAFVILPGGAGTLQEVLALMIFKQQKHPLMEGKPVVIFNRGNFVGQRFWDPLLNLLTDLCEPGDFVSANEFSDILPAIQQGMQRMSAPAANTTNVCALQPLT